MDRVQILNSVNGDSTNMSNDLTIVFTPLLDLGAPKNYVGNLRMSYSWYNISEKLETTP